MKINSINLMLAVGLAFILPFLTSSVWANEEAAVRAFYAQAVSLLSSYERCTLNVNVYDEEGHPIKGAQVKTSVEKPTIRWNGLIEIERFKEKTDSNGKASGRIKCYDGYYGEGYYNPVANSTSIEEAKRYGE